MKLIKATLIYHFSTLFFISMCIAQSENEFLITDFDGGGILPNAWQSYGDLGPYGVQNKRGNSTGKYYELVWNGSTSKGYLVSQSDITFRLIPKKRLKDKTIDNVYLKMDVNCGGAPGTVINVVLVDGPNDCCTDEVNWLYQFTKNTCEWETIEINLGEFGYAYDPSNHDKSIDINKVGRVKIGIDVFSNTKRQIVQFDNVALAVKEETSKKRYQVSISIDEEIALKSTAKDFKVGIAVNPLRVKDPVYSKIYKQEFNSITAENAMKMKSILKGIDSEGNLIYDWIQSDAIVDFAKSNNMNLHGHALIWHRSIPDFLKNFEGTDQEFESIIEKYITTVVSRYKGKVDSWDVVNEAIDEKSTEFRKSTFLERMGADYVKKCFQYARNADKDVKLFYNDYGLVYDKKKQQGAFQMIDGLIEAKLIDGVGYQMHIDYAFPSKRAIKEATDLSVRRKLLVHFSELDVRTNPKGDIQESTEQRLQAQGKKVFEVVRVFNDIPEAYKYALTVWGLKDDDSWVTPEYGHPDWPLLFDSEFKKKEAYKGFVQALK
ncbi:MAG: endo-1,4-beta-xylanase [Bacteroidota bacterium]